MGSFTQVLHSYYREMFMETRGTWLSFTTGAKKPGGKSGIGDCARGERALGVPDLRPRKTRSEGALGVPDLCPRKKKNISYFLWDPFNTIASIKARTSNWQLATSHNWSFPLTISYYFSGCFGFFSFHMLRIMCFKLIENMSTWSFLERAGTVWHLDDTLMMS